MGNSRNFRPGRRQRTLSIKQQVKQLERENAYQRGLAASLQAQLAATRMERPADLEQWIDEVALADMDPDERDAFDALSPAERETFIDQLGQRINTTRLLLDAGHADDAALSREDQPT